MADDPGMHSSQNEQDSRHYAEAAKLPMLEPADSAECLAFTKRAFELSEHLRHARCMLRTVHARRPFPEPGGNCSRAQELPLKRIRQGRAEVRRHARRWPSSRHVVVEERIEALREYAETTRPEPRGDARARSSASSRPARPTNMCSEVLPAGQRVQARHGHIPLPVERIRAFAAKVDRLYVVEELDPFIEDASARRGRSRSTAARIAPARWASFLRAALRKAHGASRAADQ